MVVFWATSAGTEIAYSSSCNTDYQKYIHSSGMRYARKAGMMEREKEEGTRAHAT